MLPTVAKGRGPSSSRPPNPVFPHYLRRIVKWQQMDIEYTFWQMFHLCTSPKVVYQHTKFHKQTKNQWARDDPAFVVICSLLLAVSTLAYCAAYDHSAGHAIFVVISILLVHFLFTGLLIATSCWFLTNNYLREEVPNSHVVEQRVEWLYAFDVHCNSFFPMFVLLYVIHYFLSPLLLVHGFIPVLLSNLLFMIAISYYHYLNFLGYDGNPLFSLHDIFGIVFEIKVEKPSTAILGQCICSKYFPFRFIKAPPFKCNYCFGCDFLTTPHSHAVLPFLERTTFFLYPIGIFIILTPVLILSGFNPSRYVMNIYFSRHL